MPNNEQGKGRWGLVVSAFLLAASSFTVLATYAPEVIAATVWSVRAQLFWIIPVVGAGLLWGITWRLTRRGGRTGAAVILSVLLLWLAAHQIGSIGQHNADSALPVPGVSLGDGFVADYDRIQYTGSTVFLDGSQDYPYTSLIRERKANGLLGGSGGYAAVVAQNHPVPQYGRTRICRFSNRAHATLDGWGSGDLTRKVNELRRFVKIDERNVYWTCQFDNSNEVGVPQVIMPLKVQRGVFFVTEENAGVAVYNGLTGQVTIEDHPPTRSARLAGVVDSIDTTGGRPLITVG